MGEKPSITGFLKGMLGFRAFKAEALKIEPPKNPDITPLAAIPSNTNSEIKRDSEGAGAQVHTKTSRTIPQTVAYQKRKKGRKKHRDGIEDLKGIIAAIQRRGKPRRVSWPRN